ncbi:helix-turn-helix transcriptional regulator [Moraxella nonliquefaciens]|uniref:helix-turn-helix transcriptional regulator n=1 Tax=Moraxella nonliquefaciens TaxID=478 RepID=UPI0024A68FB9|nr:hypothetical protein [Moraxella nonliquefaciens]
MQTLPQGGLSTAKDILPLLPFGRTTLWRKCKNGKFPKPQRLNASVTVWETMKSMDGLPIQVHGRISHEPTLRHL